MKILILNDTSIHGHYGCISVMHTLKRFIDAKFFEVDFFPCGFSWKRYRHQIESQGYTHLLINGEGTIHNTSERIAGRDLLEAVKLKIPKKVLLNSSLYKLQAYDLGLLSEFNSIAVRETVSHNLLRNFGIDSVFIPDLSFFYRTSEKIDDKSHLSSFGDKNTLILDSVRSDVSLKLECLAKQGNMAFLRMEKKPGLFLRFLAKVNKFLLPDLAFRFLIRKNISSASELDKFLERLQFYDSLLTGRFHGLTHGLRYSNRFAYVESNTPKMSWILNDIFGVDYAMPVLDFSQVECVPFTEISRTKVETYVEVGLRSFEKFMENALE